MASYWKDAFIDPPPVESEYWVRSNCGCLAPVHVYYAYGSDTWSLVDVTVEYSHVPIWAYRLYREYT